VDPVNFEKPYTQDLEGVSIVMKSTPPSLNGEKRLTRGYPAITPTIVNLQQPATTYANWFSDETEDFVSQNQEIWRALRSIRLLFPQHLRFVGDAGLDDAKVFAQVEKLQAEFVFRAAYDRRVEIYNARLARWEAEMLFDLVAHDFELERDLILLTNVPLEEADVVRQVYSGGGAGCRRHACGNPGTHAPALHLGLAGGAICVLHWSHLEACRCHLAMATRRQTGPEK
jgi:hypothetical protein